MATRKALIAEAKKKGIKGYSTMKKAELEKVLGKEKKESNKRSNTKRVLTAKQKAALAKGRANRKKKATEAKNKQSNTKPPEGSLAEFRERRGLKGLDKLITEKPKSPKRGLAGFKLSADLLELERIGKEKGPDYSFDKMLQLI